MTAGVGVAVTRGEEAGAEVTIDTTDEAEVVASKERGVIAAIAMTEEQVRVVSCQTGGGPHHRGQGRARGVERLLI
jgi:hypothetical protein